MKNLRVEKFKSLNELLCVVDELLYEKLGEDRVEELEELGEEEEFIKSIEEEGFEVFLDKDEYWVLRGEEECFEKYGL